MNGRPLFFACLFFIIFTLATDSFAPEIHTLPDNHIAKLVKEDKIKTDMTGVIRGPVLKRKSCFGKIRCDYSFEIEKLGGKRAQGMALISIKHEREYKYGDRLTVKGTIKKPPVFKKFDYRSFLERKNIFAVVYTSGQNVKVLTRDYKVNKILKQVYKIRNNVKTSVIDGLSLDEGSFLRAILIGDRSELPENIKESFRKSGTMHMIAISGLHVGLIALTILFVARFFLLKREVACLFTVVFLIFFSLLTLSKASVVRAVIMASIILVGRTLGRRTDPYNSLGAAGLFILMLDPGGLYDVGFQLSFAAVLSILYLSPRLANISNIEFHPLLKKYLIKPLAVSVSAWLGTTPFIFYYFKMFAPVSIISNLIIIPLLFVEVITGILFVMLGRMPYAGSLLAAVNDFLIRVIFNLSGFFSGLPGISG